MTEPGATLPPPDPVEAGEPADGTPETATPVTHRRLPRTGEMTSGWRVVTATCWVAVIASFAAIWNTSERLGLSTWWLGPRGDPMPVVIRLLPFVAPTVMVLLVVNNVRWLWRWGVAASLVTAAFGLGDIGGFSGLAALQLLVATAALAVSIASRTGTYRAAPNAPEPTAG